MNAVFSSGLHLWKSMKYSRIRKNTEMGNQGDKGYGAVAISGESKMATSLQFGKEKPTGGMMEVSLEVAKGWAEWIGSCYSSSLRILEGDGNTKISRRWV